MWVKATIKAVNSFLVRFRVKDKIRSRIVGSGSFSLFGAGLSAGGATTEFGADNGRCDGDVE